MTSVIPATMRSVDAATASRGALTQLVVYESVTIVRA